MHIDDAISPESLRKYAGRKDPAAMKAVAQSMETLFTYELVKEMRATTMDDNQGYGQKTYASMFDMELAGLLAQKETGLRDMILKQLEQINSKEAHGGPTPTKADKKEGENGSSSRPVTDGAHLTGASATGPLPFTGGTRAGIGQETQDMIKAAFGPQASNAIAVAMAESSGNPSAMNYNAPYGSTDYGLFQINDRFWAARLMKKGIINNIQDLFDPRKNIQAAAYIYHQGGWGLWTSVRSGRVQLGPPGVVEAQNRGGSGGQGSGRFAAGALISEISNKTGREATG